MSKQIFINLAVIDVTPNLESGESYTVLANNRVLNIAPLLLKSRREPLESGQVTVRAVHGAPSAPAVDIYVTAPNVSLSDATPVLTNVPFGAASDYLSIPAGDYQVRITVAGTKTVAIDSGALSLTANQVITLVAQDNVGSGAPFSLLALPE